MDSYTHRLFCFCRIHVNYYVSVEYLLIANLSKTKSNCFPQDNHMLSCISLFAYPTIFYFQEYLLLFFFSVPLYLYLLHCRFWTHIVMAYAFTFWTCYVLLREYEKVASMRLQFLSSERRRPDQFTVR
jgi:hypothetical protein